MKGLVLLNPCQNWIMENSGWLDVKGTLNICNDDGSFDVSIPLSMIRGFTGDYRKIVFNTKHELILTRSRNDLNAVKQTATPVDNAQVYEEFKIELNRVEWLMRSCRTYVVVADKHKIRLLGLIKNDWPISMSFRTWKLFDFYQLRRNMCGLSKHLTSWRNLALLFSPSRRIEKVRELRMLVTSITAISAM